jgi:NB-ARC domain
MEILRVNQKLVKTMKISSFIKQVQKKLKSIPTQNVKIGNKSNNNTITQIVEVIEQAKIIPKFLTPNSSYINFGKELVGRNEQIDELNRLLSAKKIVAVQGLRGIGKTALARGFVNTFQNEYDHILWVNSNRKTIFEAFGNNISLQENLYLQFEENISFEERYELICNKLHEIKTSVLIIIDNANSDLCKKSVLNKLPSLPNFRILITSNYEFPSEVFQWWIKELEISDAIELFESVSKIFNEKETIEKIISIVFSHTLTIELLASILKSHRGITLTEVYKKCYCK